MRATLLAILGAMTASACTATVVDANSFDRVCATDADCVVVLAGDVCGCGTPAAIALAARQAFDDAVAEAEKGCFGPTPPCVPQPNVTATCADARCTVR